MQFIGLTGMCARVRRVLICRSFSNWGSCLLALWVGLAAMAGAQSATKNALGLAWQVKGGWSAEGGLAPIQTGDTIKPGSLLRPIKGSPAHSITILLPDGQRILYECFLAADCERGFRVPSLYRVPDPHAPGMLWRIHAVLTTERKPEVAPRGGPPLPRDEAVATLDAQSRCEVTGLVGALSNGRYTYTVRTYGHADTTAPQPGPQKTLEKKGASAIFEIPSPGLYDVIVTDATNRPRLDLLIAAVKKQEATSVQASFRDAQALFKDWNDDFQGWPIHDFQRAYLEALVLGINPQAPPALSTPARVKAIGPGVVAEPVFTPKPGLLRDDTAVTLRCDTPGATIHFTIDNSQPFASSPVYSAPIIVKGTALTIKAFATANGKKQSAVVTGIFRIGE